MEGNAGAVSPSTITDYFKSRKANTGRQGGKLKLQKDAESSIYLTPESSPASLVDSESSVKEDDMSQKDTNLTHDKTRNSDEIDESTGIPVEGQLPDGNEVVSNSFPESPQPVSVTASISTHKLSQQKHKNSEKLKAQEKTKSDTSGETVEPAAPVENKDASPIIHAFRSMESKIPSSSPPSLPRLKLRKCAKSKTQADVDAIKEDNVSVKPKPGRRKKKEPETGRKSFITDFFPVRRSGRQTGSEIEKEKQHQLEQLILSGCEDGLEIKEFEQKGRGIVATKDFQRGDFVVEYAGDLIDVPSANSREEKYKKKPDVGCYMYYFKCGDKQHCVDATAESGRLGRLLNHSSKGGNCCTRSLEVAGIPRLILVAKRNISKGEELTYDYGDRSKASLESHPWLKL